MGIFYHPPQPPTANNAGTPPEPHVPIGTQGTSVPPRRAAAFAATMAILVAAWPADLEPRLTRPNDQQNKIAPLTLPSGQQPPRFSIASRMASAVTAWPPDLEPRLGYPNERQRTIAPLTLTYGQPPTPQGPITPTELQKFVASWQETWGAQRAPKSLAWLAPLSPYLAHTPLQSQILTAWEQPPLPPPRPVAIAPLTLPTGTAPTPQPPLSVLELAHIVSTWTQTWDAQWGPESAGWDVPPVVVSLPHVPPPSLIWTAWEPPWIAPPAPVHVAPLTLVYGQQPPRQAPLSVSQLLRIAGSWAETWDAQASPESAGWDVPPLLAVLPHVAQPIAIWAAWEPPYVAPPRPVSIAPLTLVYGTRPPVQPPLSRTVAGIILPAWPADLEPRLGRPNDERTRIAPLTLIYGTPPAPRAPVPPVQLTVIRWAWEPPWHILQFFEHGNYVPGSFMTLAPVRDTSATAIAVIAYAADPIGETFTVDLIGETFTIERLP